MFQKIELDSQEFQELEELENKIRRKSSEPTMNYNALAEAYNRLQLKEKLRWPRSPKTFGNIRTRLEERGLTPDDYYLYSHEIFVKDEDGDPVLDSDGKAIVESTLAVLVRQSDKEMAMITPKPKGPKGRKAIAQAGS